MLLTDILLQVVQLVVGRIAQFDVRQLVVGGSLARRDIVPRAVVDRERRGRGLDDVVAPDVVRPYQGVQIVTAVGSRTFGNGLSHQVRQRGIKVDMREEGIRRSSLHLLRPMHDEGDGRPRLEAAVFAAAERSPRTMVAQLFH